ncbi:hypothetical membrane protein [Renibacterium salmoninarum ATCC 33209]|uniref:Hypothetical membrane protein n=1 Tax=Renibacterium salmoninarum (strain ATCC 33209 / DSM 20767 / JCM 11484 / NBRC 15589 / NCIMB 2235) TaxID=288705 RepID=A9WM59_RENSM|nr:hypothetical protein [Renibacterium salmoninarum]ABY22047.1 hypothetical membrane protein [Renibacterium salmoninarum ATCC 33209]
MFSLGSQQTPGKRPGRWAAVGPIILAVVFLVALVMAANNNTVLGWVIAVIALAWLILATLVYVGVYKAARFGAEQVRRATSSMQKQTSTDDAGTRLVAESAPSDGARDMKLDHSFKIIQVQAREIQKVLALSNDAETGAQRKEKIERALETIEITAHNGRDMISGGQGSKREDGPEEPVTGVML